MVQNMLWGKYGSKYALGEVWFKICSGASMRNTNRNIKFGFEGRAVFPGRGLGFLSHICHVSSG